MLKHYLSFLIAGGSAFAVNTLVLFVLNTGLGFSPYIGQVIGLWSSITLSWWINRTWTFQTDKKISIKEYGTYAVSMLFSSVINFGVYALLVYVSPVLYDNPLIALVPATAASMFVSYFFMKFFVFIHEKD